MTTPGWPRRTVLGRSPWNVNIKALQTVINRYKPLRCLEWACPDLLDRDFCCLSMGVTPFEVHRREIAQSGLGVGLPGRQPSRCPLVPDPPPMRWEMENSTVFPKAGDHGKVIATDSNCTIIAFHARNYEGPPTTSDVVGGQKNNIFSGQILA